MQNNSELEKIEKDLRKIITNDSRTLIGIQLTGYASPEGSWATNEKLSAARTQALKTYISEKYGISSLLIRTSNIAEDWVRLRELVEESNLAAKREILSIIDSPENEDTKERRLKALQPAWNILLRDLFPLLRRVDYEILYTE